MTRHFQLSFEIPSRLLVIAAFVLAGIAFPTASNAAILPVGGQLSPTTTPPLAEVTPVPSGNELASLAAPYAGIGFSGTLTSKVFSNDPTNPFGATGLTFTYELSNAASSVHVLHRLSASNFTGFSTDVNYGPGTGVQPYQADRSTADVVGFNFTETAFGGFGVIQPGTQSRLLVVHTNATQHISSDVSLINGGVSTVPSFSPVPEPGTWILASLGVLGIAAFIRRIRRA
jgi:hypothetical protein